LNLLSGVSYNKRRPFLLCDEIYAAARHAEVVRSIVIAVVV
jgi:hypothetical protein